MFCWCEWGIRLAQRVGYGTLASQGLPKLRIFIIPSIHFLRTSAYDFLFKSATAFFTNIFKLDFTAIAQGRCTVLNFCVSRVYFSQRLTT